MISGEGECPMVGSSVIVVSEAYILPQKQALLGTSKPQKFKIGRNCVISGWDRGVESMKKGEVALLTCSPEWAYGNRGREHDVPPDATLQYKVTLLDWVQSKSRREDFFFKKWNAEKKKKRERKSPVLQLVL